MTAQKDYAEASDKAAAGHGGLKCPCCKISAGKRGSRRIRRRIERMRVKAMDKWEAGNE